jgi:lysophospholipase L1-like esterase
MQGYVLRPGRWVLVLAGLLALAASAGPSSGAAHAANAVAARAPAGLSRPTAAAPRLVRLGRALRTQQRAKVLAIGSSSTAGVGASSPALTYPARLEADLESALKGSDFDIVGHGMSGEVAQGAADRMAREVEAVRPDLVIWQVGTNDALHHVAIDSFKACLKKTLARLQEQGIDVILINPQYGDQLTKDPYYLEVVAAIAEVAQQAQVLLVDRFAKMRALQKQHGDGVYLSPDNLHMNDEGYRCLAEQLAATIIGALPSAAPTTATVFAP